MVDRQFVAMKAFVEHDGDVLVLRESDDIAENARFETYDVPGGRVEPGEPPQASLDRELAEETGLAVQVGDPFHVDEFRPTVGSEDWQIVATFFRCRADSRSVDVGAEHAEHKWIPPSDYADENVVPNLHGAFEHYLAG